MKVYFSLYLLLSSSLLMLVQPMVARMLLPYLGGSPSVWNTCMVFFQTGLLAGYAYAHFGPRWLGMGRHAVLHGVLLVLAVALLPIHLDAPESPPSWPALWMLRALTFGIAVPYILLASTSSLAQAWYATRTNDDPYFLYAASNLGSFVGLLGYPSIVEPNLTLGGQAECWRNAFVVFVVMSIVAGSLVLRRPVRRPPYPPGASGGVGRPLAAFGRSAPTSQVGRWILLALAPSSLMLSVTNHLTTDLASAPFLWAIPLALYLLTFVVVFSRRPMAPRAIVVRYVPIAIFFLVFLWLSEATSPLVVIVLFDLAGFTWLALFCHGELAASRPPAKQLTAFYFWIALGGVLGGLCNVLLAPLLFSAYVEYPLMLVVIGALRPLNGDRAATGQPNIGQVSDPAVRGSKARRTKLSPDARGLFGVLSDIAFGPALIGMTCLSSIVFGLFLDIPPGPAFLVAAIPPLLATLFVKRADSYALALALILATGLIWPSIHGDIIERRRSFFGVHRVARDGDLIKLIHGNTVHGMQSQSDPREPLAYYHGGSPIAAIIERMNAKGQLKSVGVVGLGSGALAAYALKDQSWTFFEIDPDVRTLAQTHFTYLTNRANVRVALGDARLTLQKSTDAFDLLIIDAFGSDSIPSHLLTREAMDIYARHMKPGGVIAFHVSNRYLNLLPVLAGMADIGWNGSSSDPGAWATSAKDQAAGRLTSWWAVLGRDRADLVDLCDKGRWIPIEKEEGFQPWSDDFINLPAVVRWRDLFRED